MDKQLWEILRLVHSDEISETGAGDSAGRDSLSDLLDLAEDRDLLTRTVCYMHLVGLIDVSGDVRQPESCIIRLNPFADRIMKGGDE